MTQVQKLEALLSRVQANRTRVRSEVAPVSIPETPAVRRSKAPTRSQSPLEIAVEHQLDVSTVGGTEPSPPPAVDPVMPSVAPVITPSLEASPPAESLAAPTTIEVAPPVSPSSPVVKLRGPVPEDAPLSFGELLSRSLALRP